MDQTVSPPLKKMNMILNYLTLSVKREIHSGFKCAADILICFEGGSICCGKLVDGEVM